MSGKLPFLASAEEAESEAEPTFLLDWPVDEDAIEPAVFSCPFGVGCSLINSVMNPHSESASPTLNVRSFSPVRGSRIETCGYSRTL